MSIPLFDIQDLSVHFGGVRAVNQVSLQIETGEILGLVGESGCGKTTLGRALLRLRDVAPSTVEGRIGYQGRDLMTLSPGKMRPLRRELQMVFQNPYTSLDGLKTVGANIAVPLGNFGLRGSQANDRIAELMRQVGLGPEKESRYPHELSGGECQRVGVARALATQPKFIVCDEPTSALDASLRGGIINLLLKLKQDHGITLLFISHDLATVWHMADRIAVMYLGRIVELGTAEQVVKNPQHPYTQALVSAILEADPRIHRERVMLSGDPPSPKNPPPGCAFHTRCPAQMTSACKAVLPELRLAADRRIACHIVS